jgi:hypothetical protein
MQHNFPARTTIEFWQCNMQLGCHSDASSLTEANSCFRVEGILFLGNQDLKEGLNGVIEYFSVI